MGISNEPDGYWWRMARIHPVVYFNGVDLIKEITFRYGHGWHQQPCTGPGVNVDYEESQASINAVKDVPIKLQTAHAKSASQLTTKVEAVRSMLKELRNLKELIIDICPCDQHDQRTSHERAVHPSRFWAQLLSYCGTRGRIRARTVRYRSDDLSPDILNALIYGFKSVHITSLNTSPSCRLEDLDNGSHRPFISMARPQRAMQPHTLRLALSPLDFDHYIAGTGMLWPPRFQFFFLEPAPGKEAVQCHQTGLLHFLWRQSSSLKEVQLDRVVLHSTGTMPAIWAIVLIIIGHLPRLSRLTLGGLDNCEIPTSRRGRKWYLPRVGCYKPMHTHESVDWEVLKILSEMRPGSIYGTDGKCLSDWLGRRSPDELLQESLTEAALSPEACYEIPDVAHWFEEKNVE